MDTFIKGFKWMVKRYGIMLPDTGRTPDRTGRSIGTGPIINCIPRTAYIEIGAGFKANGDVVTVIVLEKGSDKEELEKKPVHTDDEALTQIAELVLTPGVWPAL